MELSALPTEHEALVALVIPVLISIIVQAKMSRAVQSLIALATCAVVTVGVNAVEGDALLQNLGAVIAATFISYKAFYEPTGIADKVESMTNFGGSDDV